MGAVALMLAAPAVTPVSVKLAPVCPSGTVNDAGTVAVALFALVSVTSKPPAGAGSDRISGTERNGSSLEQPVLQPADLLIQDEL